MHNPLDEQALQQLFLEARTYGQWLDKPVSDAQLRELYDLTVLGPTSANSQPARFLFVKSAAAKERLRPYLSPGNVDKTMSAPVTVIVGADYAFYEHLPAFYPHVDARAWFIGNQPLIDTTALRNSSLQGGYLILAARALGLDAGAMSGFDSAGVDKEFFAGTTVRSNFLINLGYGDRGSLKPRSPRPPFADFAKIL
ncbi:MAG: malonic semialdehyde reductase [Moraxellaceae bacterium]|jgi:3-hydroxypropanoate dehydrogenase|nr:malonic semialdehyde reductase [Moraxellaceae bacterium]